MSDDLAPQNDTDLKELVRSLSGYDDNPDALPKSDLDSVVRTSKLRLKNKYNSMAWYSDSGYGEALLGLTLIRSKARVENYSLSEWEIGNQSVSVDADDPEDSQQLQDWNDMVNNGVENADVDEQSNTGFRNTGSMIG